MNEAEFVGIIVDAIKLNKNVCLARHFYKLNKAHIFRLPFFLVTEYTIVIVKYVAMFMLNQNWCVNSSCNCVFCRSSETRYIDVWPVDICNPIESGWGWDNSCLFLLQMACIVSMTRTWKRNITLRVFLCVSSLQVIAANSHIFQGRQQSAELWDDVDM